jgi:hypothetical protein
MYQLASRMLLLYVAVVACRSHQYTVAVLLMLLHPFLPCCCCCCCQVISRFKLPPLLAVDGQEYGQLQASLMALAEPGERQG